jgi:predicted nucleic acid-binding protein
MRFWDTSAIVPLLIHEPESDGMRELMRLDTEILASFITPIEVTSVIWRKLHHRQLDAVGRVNAESQFADISSNWFEVADLRHVKEVALDLLARHPLRSADALQLASAIVGLRLAQQRAANLPFVTLDTDLSEAARAEGFPVLP